MRFYIGTPQLKTTANNVDDTLSFQKCLTLEKTRQNKTSKLRMTNK